MSLLRIYASLLLDPAERCQWALVNSDRDPIFGEGRLAELPKRAERVQLVVPAAQVLIVRARLPQGARRRPGPLLAFAVEEKTAGDPDTNMVTWLGTVGDEDALAVADKEGLERWRNALAAVGIRAYEVHCETLLLPWQTGEWSLAWTGLEGFVRAGEFEGAATDCGDRQVPPLCLRLMLDEVQSRSAGPSSIAIYPTSPEAAPDIAAWQSELGIALRIAGTWDWRSAPVGAGVSLAQERQRWGAFTGAAVRLRPAVWIAGGALMLHAIALVVNLASLSYEQQALRQQMESRFRATFPDAVAVVDPALQMRRKLAEVRHSAGQPDSGDFLPMIEKLKSGMKDLPEDSLRVLSYESARMTLELSAIGEAAVNRILMRLTQSGMVVERAAAAKGPGGATFVITVRTS